MDASRFEVGMLMLMLISISIRARIDRSVAAARGGQFHPLQHWKLTEGVLVC